MRLPKWKVDWATADLAIANTILRLRMHRDIAHPGAWPPDCADCGEIERQLDDAYEILRRLLLRRKHRAR